MEPRNLILKVHELLSPTLSFGDRSILSVFAIPSLHLLIGLVNTIYNGLLLEFPEASAWPNDLGLVREALATFNGNSSRKLLKKADLLLNYSPRRSQMAVVKPYYLVLKALDDVVTACLGSEAHPESLEKIENFGAKYKDAKLSLTPKFHILTAHAPQFLEMIGTGLAEYAAQSNEAAHANFDVIWQKFKLSDVTKDRAKERLFNAVVEYNGNHVWNTKYK